MKERPIGVFDSGMGGLTVVRSMIDRMPDETILYLGDDARWPYGPRELDEVRGFARQIIDWLMSFDVKLVVVACNTATAAFLEQAQREYDIPLVGVILPGARAAVRQSKSGRIGVIGTKGTIASGAYERALKHFDPSVRVFSTACPEFVEFVESGEVTGDRVAEVALSYVEPMLDSGIDTLILGCTHYPLLEPLLAEVVGPDVVLISSAEETAREVDEILDRLGWSANSGRGGDFRFMTTGDTEKYERLGRIFLGPEVKSAEKVSVDGGDG
jgi:glutamate racemase